MPRYIGSSAVWDSTASPSSMFAVKVIVAGLFQTLACFYQSMCSDIPADCNLIIQNSGNCGSCHEYFMPDNSFVGRRLLG